MRKIYQSLAKPSQFTYEEKRSRFIAQVWPVAGKEAFAELLQQTKNGHPDARHICSAYLLGDPEQALSAGFNDDGEPGGTAGKPMLNVLMQRKVGDVFALVVRYFGGIKLGAGGLARAYGQAVSGALDQAELLEVVPRVNVQVRMSFSLEERARHIVASKGIDAISASYSEVVHLAFDCPEHLLDSLRLQLMEATAGKAVIGVTRPQ